jgi:hypothetical protein
MAYINYQWPMGGPEVCRSLMPWILDVTPKAAFVLEADLRLVNCCKLLRMRLITEIPSRAPPPPATTGLLAASGVPPGG